MKLLPKIGTMVAPNQKDVNNEESPLDARLVLG